MVWPARTRSMIASATAASLWSCSAIRSPPMRLPARAASSRVTLVSSAATASAASRASHSLADASATFPMGVAATRILPDMTQAWHTTRVVGFRERKA